MQPVHLLPPDLLVACERLSEVFHLREAFED